MTHRAPAAVVAPCCPGKMPWMRSWRADPIAKPIADRHYNRQNPDSAQFVQHQWAGAWINTLFRREGGEQASELIQAAVAATRWYFGAAPELGMVSFVDSSKVRRKRDPGRCYRKAGLRLAGRTKAGLLVWQMLPEVMPEPMAPLGQGEMFPRWLA